MVLEYLAPLGPPGRQVGTAVQVGRQGGNRGALFRLAVELESNGPGGCAILIRNMLIYPNLIVNDIVA